MQRNITSRLQKWYKRQDRLPLIIQGARQVGKTFAIKQFLEQNRNTIGNYHIFNFEEEESLKEIFQGDIVPDEIVRLLSVKRNTKILNTDLIFFDEVQVCSSALKSLKYFAEKRTQQPIIAAGSLLGIHLNDRHFNNQASFPVGKVQYETMGPLSFIEFLEGINDSFSKDLLLNIAQQKKTHPVEHDKLFSRYKEFCIMGGMPKAILAYQSRDNDFEKYTFCREVQANLIKDYLNDFAKYSGTANAKQLASIFHSIAQQLWKVQDDSTKKFIFSEVLSSSKLTYSRLETPIQWLIDAGISNKVKITEKIEMPINGNTKENLFKLYPLDIGILGAQLMLEPSKIFLENYGTVKGYMAETFVLQELLRSQEVGVNLSTPVCFQAGSSEVEFIIDIDGEAIPVEVKSSHNTRARSLGNYIKKYQPRAAVKFYAGLPQYNKEARLHTLPIYLAGMMREMELLK